MPSSGVQTCARSEEHTSELQSHDNLVCRLLLEKKNVLLDRKSTRLNSSHTIISCAVFCLKRKGRRGRTAGREGDARASAAAWHEDRRPRRVSPSPSRPRSVCRLPASLKWFFFFFLMIRRPPRSSLFPYTTPSR